MNSSALSLFRKQIFELLHTFTHDGLIDALSSAFGVRSVVELSLQPTFRQHNDSGLFKAIRFPAGLSGRSRECKFSPMHSILGCLAGGN